MPFVPLPFVVALLLGIMLVRLLRQERARPDGWFVAMIAAYAVQAILLGVHWGYGIAAVQPVQAVAAAAIPPFSWLGFRGFAAERRPTLLHLLAPLLVAALWLAAPALVDPVLMSLFLAYGVALLRFARRGPDALARVTLDGTIGVLHALQASGALLIASSVVDLAIAVELEHGDRGSARGIAGLASLAFVALLGWAAGIAGGATPPAAEAAAAPLPSAPPMPEPGDAELVIALDSLMQTRALHHDPTLSLDRLARRLGVPARKVSGAINRVQGMNVSQYVNAWRVGDACKLLVETEMPVTRILLDVGFQTKSNFNREFLRITGVSPSVYRRQSADQTATTGPTVKSA